MYVFGSYLFYIYDLGEKVVKSKVEFLWIPIGGKTRSERKERIFAPFAFFFFFTLFHLAFDEIEVDNIFEFLFKEQ